MADDKAIVQKQTYGENIHWIYVSAYGSTCHCFADSSISCGRDSKNVWEAYNKLIRQFPKNDYKVVGHDFIGNESEKKT